MTEHDPAAARFAAMQLVRVISMAIALLGAIIVSERWITAPVLGTMMLILGAAAFFFVPIRMARKWKSRDE